MLSLGTGEHTRSYTYEQTRGWGQLEWARPALDMVLRRRRGHDRVRGATLMGARYVRMQTELNVASDDLDDASRPTSPPCAWRPSS